MFFSVVSQKLLLQFLQLETAGIIALLSSKHLSHLTNEEQVKSCADVIFFAKLILICLMGKLNGGFYNHKLCDL